MSKILFTVVPAAGHMNPTIPIAQALQARGHQVRYLTGLSKVALLERAGLSATALLPGRFDTVEMISHPVGAHEDSYNPLRIFTWIHYFLKLIELGVVEMERILADWRPDLVVTDFSTPVGLALARRNHLPFVTTCTVPSCIRTQNGTPVFLGGLSQPRTPLHHLRDWGGRQLHELLRGSLTFLLRPYWRRLQIKLNLPDGGDGLYSPDAILGLAPKELEYSRSDWPAQLHWVGPIEWSEAGALSPESLAFLQSGQPTVFVTFGSEWFERKEALLRLICQTLTSNGICTVVTGGGAVDLSALQLPNLHVLPYAPYPEILPRVTAVIHHGGAGITYSTLRAGKPALVIPDGKDQPDNAQKVVEAGVGLRLNQPQVTPARVQNATSQLLTEIAYHNRAAHIAEQLERYTPVPTSVDVIEALLERKY
ncbi:MAG: glycosyltransferase [Caldilineaceae bacterium]